MTKLLKDGSILLLTLFTTLYVSQITLQKHYDDSLTQWLSNRGLRYRFQVPFQHETNIYMAYK